MTYVPKYDYDMQSTIMFVLRQERIACSELILSKLHDGLSDETYWALKELAQEILDRNLE